MNEKTIKKIRKEINSKEEEVVQTVFDYLNKLPFWKRLKIAGRLLRKKL